MAVIVIGMHRSGTSVATRLLNLAGLPTADERILIEPAPDNPRGYWEVSDLTALNDQMLGSLGADWSAPPVWPADFRQELGLASFVGRAHDTLRRVMPVGEWVWKDPRTSITLPLWRQVIAQPVAVVFVTRDPLEVASSLASRDGFSFSLSVALWEWYVRACLTHMTGMPVLVAGHRDLLEDPVAWARQARSCFEEVGIRFGGFDEVAMRDFVDRSLWRAQADPHQRFMLSEEQSALLAAVASLPAWNDEFPQIELPPNTRWAQDLIAERRALSHLKHRLGSAEDALEEARRLIEAEVDTVPLWWRSIYRAARLLIRGGPSRVAQRARERGRPRGDPR